MWLALFSYGVTKPNGLQDALWGESSQIVQGKLRGNGWRIVQNSNAFPAELQITMFELDQKIAGYDATTKLYFYKDQFFQSTIAFDFSSLENFSFNYNVFISVDRYYREIRSKSLTFVSDIYSLLRSKYGKKQPTFVNVDPRNIFANTDNYIYKERWNLRYHPSEYYKRIIAVAYAQWKYPKTDITFAVNISAADKRFDYTLSLTSVKYVKEISKEKSRIRVEGL